MQVTINISDEQVNKIIEDNINGLSKDQVAEAITEGIKMYLAEPNSKNTIEKIMFTDGYTYGRRELTFTGKEILAKVIDNDQLKGLENSALNLSQIYLKEIMIEAFMKLFLDNISQKLDLSYGIMSPDVQDMIKAFAKQGIRNE